MKKAPTLADAIVRESWRPDGFVPASARVSFVTARRFTLDLAMSAFLADLTHEAFLARPKQMFALIESLRRSARTPHPKTWIEYDPRAKLRRLVEKGYSSGEPPAGFALPSRVGWFINQYPNRETAYDAVVFVQRDDGRVTAMPWSWTWISDDDGHVTSLYDEDEQRLMTGSEKIRPEDDEGAELAVGIKGYRSDKVAILANSKKFGELEEHALRGMNSELRTIWALLATINDLPVSIERAAATGGYVARGRYRHFLDHSVVHLKVPGRRTIEQVARSAVMDARKRAHEVRGHWRIFLWEAPRPCGERTAHVWDAANACACGAQRTWIAPHQRGDASFGFVTHEYLVERTTDD